MNLRSVLAVLIGTMCLLGVANAQVYKSVDANGKVTFSDTPPEGATKVEARNFDSSDSVTASLPYTLATPAKSMPVTLYTSTNCQPCVDGKAYLKQIGIPFNEKTVTTNADVQKVTELTGGSQMPILTIGSIKLIGYNIGDWRSNLTLAGYPESNMLPSDYQYPAAQPAAAAKAKTATGDNTSTDGSSTQVPDRDPNAFHF
jgi:glutaredoxin